MLEFLRVKSAVVSIVSFNFMVMLMKDPFIRCFCLNRLCNSDAPNHMRITEVGCMIYHCDCFPTLIMCEPVSDL
eukprot:13370906-Ditylum_brightwellii.AAC.1